MSEDLQKVADFITANIINTTKEVLTSDEAAKYMGISKSYLYKLTMLRKIPHFKPMGKMCYFNRAELENWLQSNRIATDEAITSEAQSYCMRKGGKGC
jgi:excisionase family DNA binding protein